MIGLVQVDELVAEEFLHIKKKLLVGSTMTIQWTWWICFKGRV